MGNFTIHCGDCIEYMRTMPDKCVDLIVNDPPYNIGKVKAWDKWKKQEEYIEWCGKWILESQRILKDNGSFYFFHNDMPQIAMLMEWIRQNTKYVFKQFITWNKKYTGSKNEGCLQGYIAVNNLRNYNKMAEYILFYTFQDDTGLTTVKHDTNNFKTLRKYFYDLLCFIGCKSSKDINKALGHRGAERAFYVTPKKQIIQEIGQKADHCFRHGSTQWDLPTRETYQELIDKFHINEWQGFREYESLRQEYESLRQEYESLRYTFNNQKTHHSIWEYDFDKKDGHVTQKPTPLLENILKHSSNTNDLVFDAFMGSGTTGVACVNLGRRFIGCEIDEGYFKIAEQRIREAKAQHDN